MPATAVALVMVNGTETVDADGFESVTIARIVADAPLRLRYTRTSPTPTRTSALESSLMIVELATLVPSAAAVAFHTRTVTVSLVSASVSP
jgi:hypothetical protein